MVICAVVVQINIVINRNGKIHYYFFSLQSSACMWLKTIKLGLLTGNKKKLVPDGYKAVETHGKRGEEKNQTWIL